MSVFFFPDLVVPPDWFTVFFSPQGGFFHHIGPIFLLQARTPWLCLFFFPFPPDTRRFFFFSVLVRSQIFSFFLRSFSFPPPRFLFSSVFYWLAFFLATFPENGLGMVPVFQVLSPAFSFPFFPSGPTSFISHRGPCGAETFSLRSLPDIPEFCSPTFMLSSPRRVNDLFFEEDELFSSVFSHPTQGNSPSRLIFPEIPSPRPCLAQGGPFLDQAGI